MRRLAIVLAVLASLWMASIAGASAGTGGVPDNNACFGQAVKSLASTIDFGELMRWEAQNDTVPLAGPGASAETHYYQMCRNSD